MLYLLIYYLQAVKRRGCSISDIPSQFAGYHAEDGALGILEVAILSFLSFAWSQKGPNLWQDDGYPCAVFFDQGLIYFL